MPAPTTITWRGISWTWECLEYLKEAEIVDQMRETSGYRLNFVTTLLETAKSCCFGTLKLRPEP